MSVCACCGAGSPPLAFRPVNDRGLVCCSRWRGQLLPAASRPQSPRDTGRSCNWLRLTPQACCMPGCWQAMACTASPFASRASCISTLKCRLGTQQQQCWAQGRPVSFLRVLVPFMYTRSVTCSSWKASVCYILRKASLPPPAPGLK